MGTGAVAGASSVAEVGASRRLGCRPAAVIKMALTVVRSSGAVFMLLTVSSMVAMAGPASKAAKASQDLRVIGLMQGLFC